HDLFNLVCLPVIVIVNIWAISIFFLHNSSRDTLELAWTIQIGTLNSYIFADTVWICCSPESVSAFKTIVMHHFIVFFGWILVPNQVVSFRPIATCLLSVEINTLFMIARKFQPLQTYPRIVSFLRIGFYATWIPLRIVIFPFCCYLGYREVINFYNDKGTLLNIATLGWTLLVVITALNAKWTFDL
ncbi:unnamed protein product, partial [Ectocarpus fasciculatus]